MSAKKRSDIFANIARDDSSNPQPHSDRRNTLIAPEPPRLPAHDLPFGPHNPSAAFSPLPRVTTGEQLTAELEELRNRLAPFMRDLAPPPAPTRVTLNLDSFDWRLEQPLDQTDFAATLRGEGEWERIHVPHYGAPLGRAVTYYRTTFDLTSEMMAKGALWACFKGVDYEAHVFVNNAYVGSHEGFFAPFEFDFTPHARVGENILLIKVENDAIQMGNDSWGDDGDLHTGDKIYAATGPGYDDPQVGWHHCPPGMGIYQDVSIEARAPIHVSNLFVRPLAEPGQVEAHVEIYSTDILRNTCALQVSLYGQNFRERLLENEIFELSGKVGPTRNDYPLAITIPNPRTWEQDSPWLYQLQVSVLDQNGEVLDTLVCQFGLRTFRMDESSEPKGMFYLNERPIRLRGANTMGHMQQCVMKKDWDQLRDDILLCRLCNMNYFRLTQRPVQPEIYEFCDRLGMLTQTDLPFFGVVRRNKVTEAVRQAGEMERLVRNHPCNIMVTYINEPFPAGRGELHRQCSRIEMERFFDAATQAVLIENPDRVIKPVDGDYDPPGPSMPDNHCYCGWYNGHGVDIGALHKGYWQPIKPDWYYGCGEFGAEGLDPVNVMRKYYPPEWLPQTPEEEGTWMPDAIVKAQTGRFHYMWFDTQHSLQDWVTASQAHQAWATKLMTEAFRRDSRMVSCAIHLSIDAFPSGWMKVLMDVDRQPKPAYFAYREALTPLMVNLRSDRWAVFAGEELAVEAWVCNDRANAPANASLRCQIEDDQSVVYAAECPAEVPVCSSAFQGWLRFAAPTVAKRSTYTLRLALVNAEGRVLHDTALPITVFPATAETIASPVAVLGAQQGPANRLATACNRQRISLAQAAAGDVILIDDYTLYDQERDVVDRAVRKGARALFLELAPNEYQISADRVNVIRTGMNPRQFCSRATGHPLVSGFQPEDFKFWCDDDAGYVTPLLSTTFSITGNDGEAGWEAILSSGNGGWSGDWGHALAAARKPSGQGDYVICQIALANRIQSNPVARLFAQRLLGLE